MIFDALKHLLNHSRESELYRLALRLYTRSQNVNNRHEEIILRLLKKYVPYILHRKHRSENDAERERKKSE